MRLDVIKSAVARKIFRGSIIDNCKRFRFCGEGYKSMPAEQGGYFKIETARQIAGPLDALTDPDVRYVHVIGAIQVLKSMTGECFTVYAMEHLGMPMIVFFEDQDKAELFTSIRLMDTIKNHPELSKVVEQSKAANRHNITNTKMVFPGGFLLVCGLNEGNASTISWPLVWVSEAWQHGNDGLLNKAFKRTDRYAKTCKVLNESQASKAGTDLHNAVITAHQVPLVWRCPSCDGEQTWEYKHWSYKRPTEFKPRRQKTLSTVMIGGQLATIETTPKPQTYAGMIFTGRPEFEGLNTEQKARAAYWECIHCGHYIHDTLQNRKDICKTYTQDYRVLENGVYRTPEQVCFTIPFEAAYNNAFSRTVAKFIAAKDSKQFGNNKDIETWFLADRAYFYEPNVFARETISISQGSYDPNEVMPDEESRDMAVDCQQDQDHFDRTGQSITGWFWYIVRVYDKHGATRQLARGYCKTWDAWRAVQHRWGVPNDRVVIDIKQWSTQIQKKAVDCREVTKLKPVPPFYMAEKSTTWTLLYTEQTKALFLHADKSRKPFSPPQPIIVPMYTNSGQRVSVTLNKVRFDKKTIQLQLDAIRSGAPGMPKFESLHRDQLVLPDGNPDELSKSMETGYRTYENQMDSQFYDDKKDEYVEIRPDDHYSWCEQALLVRQAIDGKFGHVMQVKV